jgi:hypothetical protein
MMEFIKQQSTWAAAAVAIVALAVGGPVACTMKQNREVAAMVERGASPFEAACAFAVVSTTISQCAIIHAARHGR